MSNKVKKGKLVIISGPSGVGKTTIVKKLLEIPNVVKSISATTRKRRPNEINGKDYYFYSRRRFEEGIRKGEFLEYTEVFDNLYGTPRKSLEKMMLDSKIAILEIDIQGTRSIKKLELDCFSIFIMPPNLEELKKRLTGRKSENPLNAKLRLNIAKKEMIARNIYDMCVVNEDVGKAVSEIKNALIKKGIL